MTRVVIVGYFIKKRKKQNSIPPQIEEKKKDFEESAKKENPSGLISRNTTFANYEMTTGFSLEILKKNELTISKQVNMVIGQITNENENEEDNINVNPKEKRQSENILYKKEYKSEIDENQQENIKEMQGTDLKTHPIIERKISGGDVLNNQSVLNMVSDLRRMQNDNSFFTGLPQTSILLPNRMEDEVRIGFDDAGYNSSGEEEFHKIPELFPNEDCLGQTGTKLWLNKSRKISMEEKAGSTIYKEINNAEDLRNILLSSDPNVDKIKVSITTSTRIIENEKEVEIIPEDLLLVILEHLYQELNLGLIELSDNFTEERRKYFRLDNQIYISIINLFLRKKEEYFLAVLSQVMLRLDISQSLLDNTLVYFMNHACQLDERVIQIKEAYQKIYQAGVK